VPVRLDEVVGSFDALEDPCSEGNLKHPLVSVVVIALLAVLAGAGGPTALARWARLKADLLVRVLDLPHGIPGQDVFRRVLLLVQPAAFQACFAQWLPALRAKAAAATGIDQPILAVDGKTARRSHDRGNHLGALHTVSVWASAFGLALGQQAWAQKSNEITAIPELLRLVDLKGALITIDAMGCQKAIAEQVIDQGADYVLALKGNQETWHQAVIASIDEQCQDEFANAGARHHATHETGHGRDERRLSWQMPVPETLADGQLCKGLKSLGLVVSVCQRDGKETIETRSSIRSLAMGVKQFARAVRSHWGRENSCHWSLDVTFREDDSRIREK
jgi:predicted transposase YbfD/YdcC